MKTLKLVHPIFGLVTQEVIRGYFSEVYIKNMWRKKYGKRKYKECESILYENERVKF